MLERDVIRRVLQNTKKLGVKHVRMTFRGGVRVTFPDFIFLIPGGRPYIVEFKAPGKKPTKGQQHTINELKELGYDVDVHDNPTEAIDAITQRVEAALISGEGP